jgi:glycerol-3-phosphate dehydrogenase
MAARAYDVVVVGGGITGACVARDAAMRGLSVALVEKNDFASATSSASSKLIHGGLRYLQNLEIGLVRESLRERRVWSNIAPHLVEPLTFLIPGKSEKAFRNRLKMSLGLTAYDWLAYERNKPIDDAAKALPGHRALTREELLELEPALEVMNPGGAMLYYDYQMYSPERLALACLMSAVEHGAEVANYAEVTGFVREEDGRIGGVRVRDRFTHEGGITVRAGITINAAGPWADLVMAMLSEGNGSNKAPRHQLIRSKGIHLLTRPLTNGHAVAVPSEHGHFFILPWRGHSIIGTTDTVYRGDPDTFHVTEKDINDFLETVNEGFPSAQLRRDDVLHFYGGLRPLVDPSTAALNQDEETEKDSYVASRAAELHDHEDKEGIAGVITAMGGKWTTARSLAQQIVDLAFAKLGREPVPCMTDEVPVWGGGTGVFDEFLARMHTEYAGLQPEVTVNLARNYGVHMGDIVALAEENEAWAQPLGEGVHDIGAQVIYAMREEMAFKLEDVLFRRTGLGTLGKPAGPVMEQVSGLMAEELGWPKRERALQIEGTSVNFQPRSRTRAIVNPHSMGDRTGANWPTIEGKLTGALGHIDTFFTDGPMAAKRLTREALKDGVDQIIAVGGDGTVNEVVNGFFEKGKAINPEAVLVVVASGTGGDFRRTFRIPESIDEQIARLAESTVRTIDLGKLTYRDDSSGEEAVRYFDNIASFGLSGLADRVVNNLKWGKKLGTRFAFTWGMIKAALAYRCQPVRIRIDDTFDRVLNINTVAVCNGKYFGGGMMMGPNAEPDDGLFDVVIVRDLGAIELLLRSQSIYKGAHLAFDRVEVIRGMRVTAEPVHARKQPILLDVDGEAPGRLPASFEILPNAINLRY